MKYVSIFAGLFFIGVLIVAFMNKQDAMTTPQSLSSARTNAPITVEGDVNVMFPTRK